jgi:cytochrome b561
MTEQHLRAAPPHGPRHGIATRIVHMALAGGVIVQLSTSAIMDAPQPGRPDDIFFTAHSYAGLVTMAAALAFWIVVMARRRGTDAADLIPWVSRGRRADVAADLGRHWRAIRSGAVPEYEEWSPLASAIHGLGLLLMTTMAGLGTVWFLAGVFGAGAAPWVGLVRETHGLAGNLVYAYLIGHAGLGLLHHLRGQASLAGMWSLNRRPTPRPD